MDMLTPGGEAARPVSMRFSGSQSDLFRILLRGSLLQIPTFGLYRFWLITDVRRHLWSNTRIGADSFEYTGRGKELLNGFAIALTVLVPVYLVYSLLTLEAGRLQAFGSIALLLLLCVLRHYAAYRARRYRATRTILRGMRFSMTGSAWAFARRAVLWDLVTLLTLGLAYPWRSAALERYKMRNTRYGTLEGDFVGTGAALFRCGGWIWPLILVGLAAVGVASALERGGWSIGLGVLLALTFATFRAMELSWWLDGVRFGRLEVASGLDIRVVVWCYVKTLLAWLGYAILAWLVLRLVAGLANGLFHVTAYLGGHRPVAIGGGLLAMLFYIALLLGLDIIRRLFLDRGVWAAAADSVTLRHVDVLHEVAGAGAVPSGSVGEGMLDALDMGGF
jgi:hypothetical protein